MISAGHGAYAFIYRVDASHFPAGRATALSRQCRPRLPRPAYLPLAIFEIISLMTARLSITASMQDHCATMLEARRSDGQTTLSRLCAIYAIQLSLSSFQSLSSREKAACAEAMLRANTPDFPLIKTRFINVPAHCAPHQFTLPRNL